MGCWNETCFLTNLPIHCDDEIVVLPLVKSNVGLAECTPSRYSHPAPFFIYGKYDDYGGVVDPECAIAEYVLNELNVSSLEKLVDIRTKIVLPTIGNFVDSLSGEKKTHADMEMTYMLRGAFDNLLKNYVKDEFRHGKYGYEELVKDIPEYYEQFKYHNINEAEWALIGTMNRVPDWDQDKGPLRNFVKHHIEDVTYSIFRHSFAKILYEFVENDDYANFKTHLIEFCKMIILVLYMHDSRRLFIPNRGYSQSIETKTQKLTAQIILNEAEKIDRWREEDDFPDDAWDPVREIFIEQCEIEF